MQTKQPFNKCQSLLLGGKIAIMLKNLKCIILLLNTEKKSTLKLLWQLSDWNYWQLQTPFSLCSTLHGDQLHNFLWNVETKSSTRPTYVPRFSEEKRKLRWNLCWFSASDVTVKRCNNWCLHTLHLKKNFAYWKRSLHSRQEVQT